MTKGSGRDGLLERWLLAAAAALLVLGNARGVVTLPPYAPVPRTDELVRVVTWNVGGGVGQGGAPLPDEHVDHVVQTLQTLDPDLVLLQEVAGFDQLDRMRQALGRDWHASMARGAEGEGQRLVVALARTDELSAFVVPTEEASEHRVLGVTFRTTGGHEVVAVTLHADAFRAATRNAEIGAAADALRAAHAEQPGALAVLAGDLNLDLDLGKRRDLFSDDTHADVASYNYVLGFLEDAARGRGATAEPDRRLDYVFVDDERAEVLTAGPWKEQRVGDMDHDPVGMDVVVGAGQR